MKNKIVVAVLVALIAGGAGGFFAGQKYAQKKGMAARGQAFQQFRGQGGPAGAVVGRRDNGGFVSGEILSRDDKSVTVKLVDGGSKIVFLSGSATISKSTEGTVSDLEVGKQIMVNCSVGSDGSVTAQSIQIRPIPVSNK